MDSFSFEKGYNQVKRGELKIVKNEIMSALNLLSKQAFYARLYGKVEPRMSEIAAIEQVFKNHGITEIWGK